MSTTRGPASSFYDLPVPWVDRMQARLDRRPWFGVGMLYVLPVLLDAAANEALEQGSDGVDEGNVEDGIALAKKVLDAKDAASSATGGQDNG